MQLFKIILLMTVSATLTQCMFFHKSAKKTNAKFLSDAPYDVIIVPGYPHEQSKWDQVVQLRILWAKQLYEAGSTKNIMFSGSAVYTPYIESRVMAKYAEALGVPAENIFTEENARHSTENLYYSYTRARELGFEKIALASDPFQTNMLRLFRKRYNLEVGLLPVVFKELKNMDAPMPEIDASDALVSKFISITDSETISERINGTLGNNIRWREEDLKKKKQVRRQRKRGMLILKKNTY